MTEKYRGTRSPTINDAHPQVYQMTMPRNRQNPDMETIRLRQALVEAIQQNETLRERVIELQALLGAAGQEIESCKARYASDLNRLYKAIGVRFEGEVAHKINSAQNNSRPRCNSF